jgi:hypothetical protein
MSMGRVLARVPLVAFTLLLITLMGADTELEFIGLTLPVWVVALGSYLLGWAATVGTVMQRKDRVLRASTLSSVR